MAFIQTLLVVIFASFAFIKLKSMFEIPDKPTLEETWWKISKPENEDTSIRSFKIEVSDRILQDLEERLNKSLPLQPSLDGSKQHYGIHAKLLSTVVDFWKTKYNWKERERKLNQYPQFKTNIQGLDIHYVHVKPKQTDKGLKILPLLMLHGWPGSVREFYEIIPILTTPKKGRDFVFELIIPSLPGYGFSDAAQIPGLSTPQLTILFKNLMIRLNFKKYYIHGTDWGAFIVSQMSAMFPEKISGMHSTICWLNTPWAYLKLALYSFYPSLIVDEQQGDIVYPLKNKFKFLVEESGYMHLQGTKPDTIGTALMDSPVGLAAYILEKFSTWTNPSWRDLENGGLTEKFKIEELLDNIMIYWVTRSITTSMRLYAEYFNQMWLSLTIDSLSVEIPTGCSQFRNELTWMPESILKSRYRNLVHLSNHQDGGHFIALEMPHELAEDIFEFVGKILRKTPKGT